MLGLGAGWAFALDAATFLVSVGFLLRVRGRVRGEAPARQAVRAELSEGWAAVRERAWLWSILLCFAAAVLLSFAPWFTLGPTVAKDVYGSTGVFGLLVAAMGAGTIAGAVTGLSWRAVHPLRTGMLLALPWPASSLSVALGLPLPAAVPAFVLAGFGIALFGIWWETALAERVPPHLLSRVSAYDWLVSLSLLPVGYLLAGRSYPSKVGVPSSGVLAWA